MFSIQIQNSHLNLFLLLKNDDGVFEGFEVMNKASGDHEIPADIYKILKDDSMKVLYSICQQIWKIQQLQRAGKFSFHSSPKERQCQRMFKLLHNYSHLTC